MASANGKTNGKGKGKCTVPPPPAPGKGKGKCTVPPPPAPGKGKGKCTVPPPPAPGKGEGKDRTLTIDSVACGKSRAAMLSANGDTIEGVVMSGNVLFSFPAAFLGDSTLVRVVRRKVEELILGDAFKLHVRLLRNGALMDDDDVISDINGVVVTWRKGWSKVIAGDELEAQKRTEMDPSVAAIALPIETEGMSFEKCHENVLQLLCGQWKRDRKRFEEEHENWGQEVRIWEQEVRTWEEEQAKRESERAKWLEAWEAKGQPKGKGKMKGMPYPYGKGKGGGKCPARPATPKPAAEDPPKKVAGFLIAKGRPGRKWRTAECLELTENRVPPIAEPVETEIPNFHELRHVYIESLLRQAFLEYDDWKAREAYDTVCAESCKKARKLIRVVPAARPKSDLQIPQQKSVGIFETVRTHLRPACARTIPIACGANENLPLPAFGFCVDINLHGNDLSSILELMKTGCYGIVAQHACVYAPFKAEAARLGIHLEDVLKFLEVRVLDKIGCLSYPIYPPQSLNYVDPTGINGNVDVVFLVGPCGLPQCYHDTPSAVDLCKVAINPRSYNEHKRLALEALTITVANKDPQVGSYEKKGLVTIACLLATHSDAAVREQAQELLVASATDENLSFVANFFDCHRYPLGNRIVQDTISACQDKKMKDDA